MFFARFPIVPFVILLFAQSVNSQSVSNSVKESRGGKKVEIRTHTKEEVFATLESLVSFLIEEGYQWHYDSDESFLEKVADVQVTTYEIQGDLDAEKEYFIIQSVEPKLYEDQYYDASFEASNLFYIDLQHDGFFIADSIIAREFDISRFAGEFYMSDLDEDGITEVHLEERTQTTGPGVGTRSQILTIADGKLVLKNGVSGLQKVFDEKEKCYYKIRAIWQVDEGRYGNHFYELYKFQYDQGEFSLISLDTTERKLSYEEATVENVIEHIQLSNEKPQIFTSKQLIVQLVSCEEIENNHVGNEWAFGALVDGRYLSYGGKITIRLENQEQLEIKSLLSEGREKYNDSANTVSFYSVADFQIGKDYVIEQDVTITEGNGRYAGEIAIFRFSYFVDCRK